MSGRISQSDEVVKNDTSCDYFSLCLWSLVHGRQQSLNLCARMPNAFSTKRRALESLQLNILS